MIGSFAVMTMLTKNTFVEEMRKQYVLVARAKGLSQQRVLYKHIFRNALIPLVTGFPAAFVGAFFAGSVLIETLFSLDGLGLLGYESVIRRDYPVVLGSLYLFTLIGLVVKLVSDLLYVVVDPRVQFGSAAMSATSRQRRDAVRTPSAMSPNQRAWARFKRNRMGYVLAVDLRRDAAGVHAAPSWSATTGPSSRACRASGCSRCSATRRETALGGDFGDAHRLEGSVHHRAAVASPATGRCSRSTRTRPRRSTTSARRPIPRRRARRTGSAPTTRAATCWRA